MNSNRFRLTAALLLVATGSLLTAVAESANRATTCDHDDGNVQRLDCGHGVISVIDSVYGCSNPWVCTDEGQSDQKLTKTDWTGEVAVDELWSQESTSTTVDELKMKCNGRKSCEVSLTGFPTRGTCVGAFKYLQTTFTCLEPMTVVACQGAMAHLDCGLGHVITIDGAAYGRRDQTTCSEGRPFDQRQNVECMQPSTAMVVKMCEGKSTCLVPASNAVFTNPCQGTYKYLEISYTCKPPEADDPDVL